MPVPIDMNVDMTVEFMKTISNVKPTFLMHSNISQINSTINYRTNEVTIPIIHKYFDSGLINKFIRLEF
jgi:hypothetical protein